jgi:hypothetical protein
MLMFPGAVWTEDRNVQSNPRAKPFHWGGTSKKCPKNNTRFWHVVFCALAPGIRRVFFEKRSKPLKMGFRTGSSMAS